MTEKERIHKIVENICLYETRGSLEYEATPYFSALNKHVNAVPRGLLEQYVFIVKALRITPTDIYKIYIGENLYKGHTYYSAFETIRYILNRTDFAWINEPQYPIDKASGKTVRIVRAGTLQY